MQTQIIALPLDGVAIVIIEQVVFFDPDAGDLAQAIAGPTTTMNEIVLIRDAREIRRYHGATTVHEGT